MAECGNCHHPEEAHVDGLDCCVDLGEGTASFCPCTRFVGADWPDWARLCATRWWMRFDTDVAQAIEGAVREALAKAAQAAVERTHDLGIPADKQRLIEAAIRALGAK